MQLTFVYTLFQASDKITEYPSIYFSNKDNPDGKDKEEKDKEKFIIPVFNVVIKVDAGKITGVVW